VKRPEHKTDDLPASSGTCTVFVLSPWWSLLMKH